MTFTKHGKDYWVNNRMCGTEKDSNKSTDKEQDVEKKCGGKKGNIIIHMKAG